MNPYQMWEEQTPRQVYELLITYKELHKEDKDTKTKIETEKDYKVVGNVKIPEWLKGRIKPGTTIYNADDVTQDQMGL